MHVQKSKFGGKIYKFGGKYFKKLNSTEFMEFVFSKSAHREAGPLIGTPGLSQGGRASDREAGPLKGKPGLSK